MYRFQIIAPTQPGESIGIVGSAPELGSWDITRYVPLKTNSARYPVWFTDTSFDLHQSLEADDRHRLEYKYVWVNAKGIAEWEAFGLNRWLPIDAADRDKSIVVDDGAFGYLQPYPFGYAEQAPQPSWQKGQEGLKIVVIGSSVAVGHRAWLLNGWVSLLGESLHHHYGHQLVNVSESGANVGSTIARFPAVVPPEHPDMVIIALSLGNEGLAQCPPHERRAAQRRFESGLQRLVRMTRDLGARPILGGVYPHGNYSPEHYWLLKDTHNRMMTWGVPVLNWLGAVDNGEGRWRDGISFDPAHPNTIGHRLMHEAIDLRLFQVNKAELAAEREHFQHQQEIPVYGDNTGFQVTANPREKRLRIVNASPHVYTIAPYWRELQTALQADAGLNPGIYVAKNPQAGTPPCLAVAGDGTIETTAHIPPGVDVEYGAAFDLFAPGTLEVLFYDGYLGILKEDEHHLRVVNESDHEFYIHPMWQEVRSVLKAMPPGVYEDPLEPDVPFRTLMIGAHGLESRVKVSPKSSISFRYSCKLTDISRVAIVPLGARCAARMLLYKLGYDGPAYPFDLTRTTNLGDVADMIAHGFQDMWDPRYLHFNPDEKRIYHSKWSGLSFAHEVEDTDNPLYDMSPVHARMRSRYQARSQRFWYTLQHADKFLFIRNGYADRGSVMDLMAKLTEKCQGKPFRLLLISSQPSEEYAGLPNVIHHNVYFNPDDMYNNLDHWLYCTEIMRNILNSLGVSSKNLFWCPPKPPA